ncbi:hypothetical protein RHOFW104R3_36300 [Rhodanobacter denitrificans]|nr:hypothetical protein RHOFW104R3_36300 [Rhodanobacter denitrificans]
MTPAELPMMVILGFMTGPGEWGMANAAPRHGADATHCRGQVMLVRPACGRYVKRVSEDA